MAIQDTTRLLQQMGRIYPDRVQIEKLLGHSGLDGVRAVRAVRGLFEGGLITAHGSTPSGGIPGSELQLTEPGMAVAFGLACIEGDPCGAIAALETRTVRQLHQGRTSRRPGPGDGPVDASTVIGPPADRRASQGRTN